MRLTFSFIAFFCVMALFSALPSFAQDSSPTNAHSENTPPEKSIYARASDAQMEEAKKYYRLCEKTDSLNSIKNCRCAAAAYLETRLKLGDAAGVNDIIKANLNSCLKDSALAELPRRSNIDYSKVPKTYLDESMYIYNYCNENPRFSMDHDCECYAAEFLSKRIDVGKRMSQNEIMIDLDASCRNVVASTGQQYSACMGEYFDASVIAEDVTQKDYCECVARRWGQAYKNFRGDIANPVIRKELAFSALMTCRSPDIYNQ